MVVSATPQMVVMLPARNAWGAHLVQLLAASPTDISPASGEAGLPLWFLWLQTHLSNIHQGTLKKQDLLFTSPGGHVAHPGPHSQVTGREKERTWDSALTGNKAGVPRFLWGHYWILKLRLKYNLDLSVIIWPLFKMNSCCSCILLQASHYIFNHI